MVTVSIAVVVALGSLALIWRTVTTNAKVLLGTNAQITFTPLAYKPSFGPNGQLVRVPAGEFVPFESRHERYMKIAEVVTTLASASLVFVPSSRLRVYPHSCSFALVLLGFSVLYCILFMALLTYFYEGFLYDPNTYTVTKYGLVHALGFGGLFCFALAYISLAVRVGWAAIYAATIP